MLLYYYVQHVAWKLYLLLLSRFSLTFPLTNALAIIREVHDGPGGSPQWRVKGSDGPKAPQAHGDGTQDIM